MLSGKTTLIAHIGYPTEAFKAPLLGAVLPYLKAQHEDGRHMAQL